MPNPTLGWVDGVLLGALTWRPPENNGMSTPYKCILCDGTGQNPPHSCGTYATCHGCNGTGIIWSPDIVSYEYATYLPWGPTEPLYAPSSEYRPAFKGNTCGGSGCGCRLEASRALTG